MVSVEIALVLTQIGNFHKMQNIHGEFPMQDPLMVLFIFKLTDFEEIFSNQAL
jgi:hypothetical protein